MQVGMKAGQKALRKKKSAYDQAKDQKNKLESPSNDAAIENGDVNKDAMRDVTDKGNS